MDKAKKSQGKSRAKSKKLGKVEETLDFGNGAITFHYCIDMDLVLKKIVQQLARTLANHRNDKKHQLELMIFPQVKVSLGQICTQLPEIDFPPQGENDSEQ